MLNPSKGKVLYLKPGRMNSNLPTVIDSQDCLGSFGERIGRVYTLCMANNALRQAYIPWSEGTINYSFARYIIAGKENTPDPQAHLTRDGRQELPELLKSFDALPQAQRASSDACDTAREAPLKANYGS